MAQILTEKGVEINTLDKNFGPTYDDLEALLHGVEISGSAKVAKLLLDLALSTSFFILPSFVFLACLVSTAHIFVDTH